MDTISVAYVLCRIEDDSSLTPVSEHEDILTGIAAGGHAVVVEDPDPSRWRTLTSRTLSTLAIPRTGRPRAWHPSGRAGSATASGP